MKQRPRRAILRKLLLRGRVSNRFWPAFIILCVGTFLLLCSVMLWTGFRDLLSGKFNDDSIGSSYLTISKEIPVTEKITEQKPQRFTTTEIRALASLDEVQDVGMFTSALFPVEVTLEGENTSFSTNLFLESLPERFIDNRPLDWQWESRNAEVPVIVSTEFLNLYNFGYAPNRGVPQLTKGTIKTLDFKLTIGKGIDAETFKTRVAGFSDRISSILVPESFMQYGNQFYSEEQAALPTRLIVQLEDPSNESFISYIATRDYVTNNEQLRPNNIRKVADMLITGVGVLALLLLAFGCFTFYLFLESTMKQSARNIQLLLQLGYSPLFLRRFIYIRYLLIAGGVIISTGVMSIIAQVRMAKYAAEHNYVINTFPRWEVWAALGVVALLIGSTVFLVAERAVNKKEWQ